MPATGPGGEDGHTHTYEFGMTQTGMTNGHLHIVGSDRTYTSPAEGHDHAIPFKAPPGIDQDVFDAEIGQ